MRNTKFRAWDAKNKKIIQVYQIQFQNTGIVVMDSKWEKTILRGNFPLMQYTGRKAKKGVEIYEGNIVKAPNGAIGVIQYQVDELNSGFKIDLISGTDFSFDDYMGRKVSFRELEVIGNIHEHKETAK